METDDEQLMERTLEIQQGYISQLFHDAKTPCKCHESHPQQRPCWSCWASVVLSEMNVKI